MGKSKKSKKHNKLDYIQPISNFILAVVAVTALFFSYQSIQDNQKFMKEILEAIAPNEATLKIIAMNDRDDLYFGKYEFTHISRDDENKPSTTADIRLKFVNYGKMESGPIYIDVVSDWLDSYPRRIPNIEGLNYTYFQLFMFDKNCTKSDQKCKTNIPNGSQEITLRIKCNGCVKRLEEIKIPICIWEDKETECKKLWNFS